MIKIFSSIVILLLLASCDKASMLTPKGYIASQQLDLLIISVALMLLVIVPTFIFTITIAYKYRASKNNTYKPAWAHSKIIEFFCWGIPIIIILILATITWKTSHSLDPYKPIVSDKEPLEIQVFSLDWKWLFVYPEQKIATINYLRLPTDRPVKFKLTSSGAMNSFLIPALGGQIYTMAGMATTLYYRADQVGQYNGHGSNYTGRGFSKMRFKVDVVSEDDFNPWVDKVKFSADKKLTLDYYGNKLLPKSIGDKEDFFSDVEPVLFERIIMSFMARGESSRGFMQAMDMQAIMKKIKEAGYSMKDMMKDMMKFSPKAHLEHKKSSSH